ncbi:MAG: 5'-nucleotidase C-terminal domain-containing protein [Elusimicrobiota bacterium]|jgi:2',3'-cyclic-nucleotide 2'-phosphodiesterase (5'-nucleotidase family)|nr:5'-nucleotidase C-terminal domain-containing protein [Elusimicrobiota bacterium]
MKKLLILIIISAAFIIACRGKKTHVINIFHTNDIQGFYWARAYGNNDNKYTGGLSVLKEMLEKQNDPFLLFDSGDLFSQTQEGQIGNLENAINMMNKIKYTAATLSAADFGLGWEAIENVLAKAEFPFVVSNLQNADGSEPKHIKKYIILESEGIKIAVLGVLSETDFPKIQRNTQIKASNEIEALKAASAQARQRGADLIILLSSLGFELEQKKMDEKTIAEEIPEINIILGGNSNAAQGGYEQIANTFISRNGPMLFEAGKLELLLNDEKSISNYRYENIVLDEETFGRNSAIDADIADLRNKVKKITGNKITTLPFKLESFSDRQSPLGTYAADCIRRWASNDIGIVDPDIFLADFPQGNLTEIDLLNSIPFNDRVMLVKMRGDELKNALDRTLDFKNSWPQTSGINVSYDMSKPLGERIRKITLANGTPLQNNTLYSISTSDHIVDGSFGHNEFLNVFEFKNTDRTLRDIIKWCLYRQKVFSHPNTDQWKPVS